MRLRRSWQQRKGRTDEGDSKLGMPTDLRSWEASPKKHADSSESLQAGFYNAASSKKNIKTLHLLGSCHMTFTFARERLPSRRTFDGVCGWRARDERARDPGDHSSDTVTSSSTEEAERTTRERSWNERPTGEIQWKYRHERGSTLRGGRTGLSHQFLSRLEEAVLPSLLLCGPVTRAARDFVCHPRRNHRVCSNFRAILGRIYAVVMASQDFVSRFQMLSKHR